MPSLALGPVSPRSWSPAQLPSPRAVPESPGGSQTTCPLITRVRWAFCPPLPLLVTGEHVRALGRGKGKAEGPAFKCLYFLILPLWGSSPCPIPSLHLSQFCVTAPSMLSCHCHFSLPLTLNVGTGCDLMAGPQRAASSEGPEETDRRAGGRG